MAPAPVETISQLTNSGMQKTVTKTAPSIASIGSPNCINELDAAKLIFTRNHHPKTVPEPDSPEVVAQNVCTDHMITCQWTSGFGWSRPHLQPYGPLQLMPTASCLHYATE